MERGSTTRVIPRPEEGEVETMLAVGEGARQESLTLRVDESAPPSVELTRADGTVSAHVGADLFECLKSVRRLL